jgi:hypothetical protein
MDRNEHKPARGRLDAGQRAQSGTQSADLNTEPRPVRLIGEASLEGALNELIARHVLRPGLGQSADEGEQDRTSSQGDYDANGNTTSYEDGTATQDLYDAENRLIKRGSTIEIGYDHEGNRVKKTANSVTTYYLLDDRNLSGYVQVLAEYSNTANPPDRAYTLRSRFACATEKHWDSALARLDHQLLRIRWPRKRAAPD